MSLELTWLSVFADVPAAQFAASLAFWESVTGTRAGTPAGANGEFTPLVPADGDCFFWLQRIGHDGGGWHPDLYVRDVTASARHAVDLGAHALRESPALSVLATPGGQPFCLALDDRAGPRRRCSPPSWPDGRSLVDQLCLDIPPADYDAETRFWAALTGWRRGSSELPEFRRLDPPETLPVQFLLQRLGDDDAPGARAHLDLSADDPEAEVSRHRALGAEKIRVTDGWTTLRDRAGLTYCVTHRRPGEPRR